MKTEQWSKFEETETKNYFVSTAGRVKRVDKVTSEEFMLRPSANCDGRKTIIVSETGKRHYVYRLAAQAFIPNPENKPTVNHIRGLDAGDGIDNLEWATMAEQDEHARETGLKTGGYTSTVVLNTNGDVIAKYDKLVEALTNYDGTNIYYNKDVQIVGNAILMKQSFYDSLYKGEPNEDLFTVDGELKEDLFVIVNDCFERIMKFAYVVNGKLVDGVVKASELIECDKGNLYRQAQKQLVANVNGHEVSRLKNLIGVGDLT